MTTLNIIEASTRAQCHPDTLRKLMATGEAPGTKIGRGWVVSEELLQQWIDSRCLSTSEKERAQSGCEGQLLAKSIASHRKQLIQMRQKNLKTRSGPASGDAADSATVVPFRFKRRQRNG